MMSTILGIYATVAVFYLIAVLFGCSLAAADQDIYGDAKSEADARFYRRGIWLTPVWPAALVLGAYKAVTQHSRYFAARFKQNA